MKRLGIAAGALALALFPNFAFAQLDHLVCYKVIDKLQVQAAFDLFAELQPEFTAKGCKIVRVDDFCVPATKLNVDPASADQRSDIAGPALNVDFIGYLVKCAVDLTPSGKVVIDQFGTHRHLKYKIAKVYVPAKKGPPPCGTIDGKFCGGVCPTASDQCRVDAAGNCRCAPPPTNSCEGKPDKQGQCGGPCPTGETCQVVASSTGAKICDCAPPPPQRCSINTATGTCGGECPNPADKCVLKSDFECTCAPAETACALIPGTVPTCGGDCPIAGDICALDANNNCRCGAGDPLPCSQNPLTGQCGGECPGGELCRIDSTNHCSCGPTPCSVSADGVCGGACPNAAQQCAVDATGACNCSPTSCTADAAGACGGLCPTGRNCTTGTAAGGLSCLCQ
jgi:hypothetical protein